MRALLGMALLLALAWGAPAGAVIIASGDGTGNTSAPPDDRGWGNVVNLSGLTGVYLGNGWVLTANHVGSRDMIIGSDVYEPVPGSKVQLQTDGSNADLALFQIVRDPGLPDIVIRTSPPRSSPPSQASEVVMIGHGRSRGAAISACSSDGWLWVGPSTMRWGTNVVRQNGIDLVISGTLTRAFSTLFDADLPTPHEAQASTGDSGGAVFVKNGATWELAGIMTAIAACQDGSAVYGDLTYSADLSFYFDQIDDVASVPACNDGIDQDGDGLVDYPNDLGCDELLDPFETSDALPCDDGIDNDGDGLADFPDDPGCANASDSSENDPTLPCDDGVDNDGDGLIDHPDDPGCYNSLWVSENPACMDGIDNDGDTLIDYPNDPACVSPFWFIETSQCQNGIDDDGDGMMDYDAGLSVNGYADPAGPDPECVGRPGGLNERCGLGVELALLVPSLMWLYRGRSRRI